MAILIKHSLKNNPILFVLNLLKFALNAMLCKLDIFHILLQSHLEQHDSSVPYI